MNVYVWQEVKKLTKNYHSGGGLVVFARNEARARELAIAKGVEFGEEDRVSEVRELMNVWGTETVYIMPDAGCC